MSQQINLFNPLFRPRGFSFVSAQAMLYGVLLAAAGVALAALYGDYELREVTARAQAAGRAHQAATERLAELGQAVAQLKANPQLAAETAALDAQFKARREVADILRSGALGSTAGFSEYLRAFSRQTVNGLWLTGFTIDGADLTLTGRTLDPELVAGYLKQLNREEVLRGREFSALRMRQPAPDESAAKGTARAAAAPRYLEFTLSTTAVADEPSRAGAPPARAPAPAVAAVPAPPAAIAKAVEAVKSGLAPERAQ